jgi:predicted nucleotidyltransferase
MYSPEERELFFNQTINMFQSSPLIEGIVQLGSGVIGYKDEYSDIDLMVSTNKADDVKNTKEYIHRCFLELNSIYIKEITLRDNIYLLIAFLENGLEFNVSILPTDYLNVKSPLWKIAVDQTGLVTEKMNREYERFSEQQVKYSVSEDLGFEFFYYLRKFKTELNRHNLIYALKMLESMRDIVLQIQALDENKKLHQFKSYETLNEEFIKNYLNTYPDQMTIEKLLDSADKLRELFIETMEQSNNFSWDDTLINIL